MKTRITNKLAKSLYGNRLVYTSTPVGNLSTEYNPIHYNCGIYGWNWDGYSIDGYVVVYGYRNIPTKKECKLVSDENGTLRVVTL